MSNKEYAALFGLLADLMRLHGEEDFRFKSYDFAARNLRNVAEPLSEMSLAQVKEIKGVGDAIGQKIIELTRSGRMKTLDGYIEKTPPGVIELLKVKGLGPGKLRTLWLELGIESPGELLYACNENRLLLYKGFGEKTQEQIRSQVVFQMQAADQFRWDRLEEDASNLVDDLCTAFDTDLVSLAGEMRRCTPIVTAIDLVISADSLEPAISRELLVFETELPDGRLGARSASGVPLRIRLCPASDFGKYLFLDTGSKAFLQGIDESSIPSGLTEEEIFTHLGADFVSPEYRESAGAMEEARSKSLPKLLDISDVKGVIHAHTTYSDGAATLKNLAQYVKDEGFEYLVVTDHSRSAFYANGLSIERIQEQHAEIDRLNAEFGPFRIYKGIESDILSDGSLDYPDEILRTFEVVIASVHSNLRMDRDKATRRLLTAIENPFTTILGHPTGRLLLSREGYPIDHQKIIDACAANEVAIELNANPYRLDLDWSWIPYALEKGVKIAVNPDAHHLQGVHDIRFGVLSARKGGLTAAGCFNFTFGGR